MNTHHGDTETRSSAGLLSEPLTRAIIAAAIEVHCQIGPGLLESVYEECMCEELRIRRMPFKCQIELPVIYKGRETGGKYRIDLVVADEVLVELKAVERLLSVHEAQLLYLPQGDRQARRCSYQLQCIGFTSGNHTPGPMTLRKLRASVPPWWVFFARRANA